MPFLKQPPVAEPKANPAPSNPGHPPEDPFVAMLLDCGETAAKQGGSPQEIAASAIGCFVAKLAASLTAPPIGNTNPGPGSEEMQEPARS